MAYDLLALNELGILVVHLTWHTHWNENPKLTKDSCILIDEHDYLNMKVTYLDVNFLLTCCIFFSELLNINFYIILHVHSLLSKTEGCSKTFNCSPRFVCWPCLRRLAGLKQTSMETNVNRQGWVSSPQEKLYITNNQSVKY